MNQCLENARSTVRKVTPGDLAEGITTLARKHESWRLTECLNLVAAHNLMSPMARSLLSTALADKLASGTIGSRGHSGCKYIDEIEALTVELAKKLFRVNHVEYRAMTGCMANEIAINALTDFGDPVMAMSSRDSGHHSYRETGFSGYRKLEIKDIPFDEDKMTVDVDSLAKVAEKYQPKLLILGTSIFLFPYPLKEIKKVADSVGSKVLYDGAHVMGLIAGRRFQDPMTEGADVLTGSTQKTLPGPIGGLVLSNDDQIAEKVRSNTSRIMSNYHNNRVAALGVALAEMLEFGEEFAEGIIQNAKSLAKALDTEGFDVFGKHRGYTMSHQVILDVQDPGAIKSLHTLENCNIICSKQPLPKDFPNTIKNPSGLRLGTTDVTRLGMKEPEMREIAKFIRRALMDLEDPRKISKEVTDFVSQFREVKYCF